MLEALQMREDYLHYIGMFGYKTVMHKKKSRLVDIALKSLNQRFYLKLKEE